MPRLRALVKRHKDAPFTLLGINAFDSKSDFDAGAQEFEVSWPCLLQGSEEAPVSELYQVIGYPTMLLLDGSGRIRFTGLRGEAIDEAVATLLAEVAEKGE